MSNHTGTSQGDARSQQQDMAEQYVRFIAETSIPIAMKIEDVKVATSNDKTMLKAMEMVRTGRWFEIKKLDDPDVSVEELQELSNVRDELTFPNDSLLLRGNQIVLPIELRQQAVALAH